MLSKRGSQTLIQKGRQAESADDKGLSQTFKLSMQMRFGTNRPEWKPD